MTLREAAYAMTIILATLKLAEIGLVADLSWWLVLAPIWLPVVALWAIFALVWAFINVACWTAKK